MQTAHRLWFHPSWTFQTMFFLQMCKKSFKLEENSRQDYLSHLPWLDWTQSPSLHHLPLLRCQLPSIGVLDLFNCSLLSRLQAWRGSPCVFPLFWNTYLITYLGKCIFVITIWRLVSFSASSSLLLIFGFLFWSFSVLITYISKSREKMQSDQSSWMWDWKSARLRLWLHWLLLIKW